jgi:hypothetical protein
LVCSSAFQRTRIVFARNDDSRGLGARPSLKRTELF